VHLIEKLKQKVQAKA